MFIQHLIHDLFTLVNMFLCLFLCQKSLHHVYVFSITTANTSGDWCERAWWTFFVVRRTATRICLRKILVKFLRQPPEISIVFPHFPAIKDVPERQSPWIDTDAWKKGIRSVKALLWRQHGVLVSQIQIKEKKIYWQKWKSYLYNYL